MKVVIRPLAESDIRALEAYYENIRVGLASGVLTRLETLLALITAHPRMYAIKVQDIRAVRIRRTPYVLYYVVLEEEIHVIAVMHGARDEEAWKSRC